MENILTGCSLLTYYWVPWQQSDPRFLIYFLCMDTLTTLWQRIRLQLFNCRLSRSIAVTDPDLQQEQMEKSAYSTLLALCNEVHMKLTTHCHHCHKGSSTVVCLQENNECTTCLQDPGTELTSKIMTARLCITFHFLWHKNYMALSAMPQTH